ncbi:cytochrome C biogenesis protein [Paraburkholderia graminis]|uniref:DnaJ C-terminal domain-containing protein n=1 Tax=Paraburkholderia graminis TaxID=60548 RepID=UPI000DEF241E|nr:DnaJ C-terminal domain-containing protein [Paraburkholderia graminis]AXF06515.1 cytochrome C biogenesis protein [Paraburkholderia graminis]
MKYKDYYEVLGVPRTATQDEVRRAYRKLARKYHPDVSQQADGEDRFKELGEAYQVLKDTEKRAAYDRLGREWQNGQDFRPPPDWDEGFEFSGAGNGPSAHADFSEFFEAMFGGAHTGGRSRQTERHGAAPDRGAATADDLEDAYRGGRRPIPGQDHHARVVIDLVDAYYGAQRSVSLQMPVLAHGQVILQLRTLNVTIPRGVRAGQHLRLAGQGGAGPGHGPAGDLYLEISFRDDPRFRVDGRDVSLDLPVAPWEAALGAQVTVATPDASVELTVPAGSASGRRLRLKGKGIPGKTPGDLYVILTIVLPPADSDSARAAYETMRHAFHFDPRAHFTGGRP